MDIRRNMLWQKNKNAKRTFMYEWKRISLPLCSELFSITSLLHRNILPAQKYCLFRAIRTVNARADLIESTVFKSGYFVCLCCQILALTLPLDAWCLRSTKKEEELLYRDHKSSKVNLSGDCGFDVCPRYGLGMYVIQRVRQSWGEVLFCKSQSVLDVSPESRSTNPKS